MNILHQDFVAYLSHIMFPINFLLILLYTTAENLKSISLKMTKLLNKWKSETKIRLLLFPESLKHVDVHNSPISGACLHIVKHCDVMCRKIHNIKNNPGALIHKAWWRIYASVDFVWVMASSVLSLAVVFRWLWEFSTHSVLKKLKTPSSERPIRHSTCPEFMQFTSNAI